jgi:hypothetical protein
MKRIKMPSCSVFFNFDQRRGLWIGIRHRLGGMLAIDFILSPEKRRREK